MTPLQPFAGPVWRWLSSSLVGTPTIPPKAPNGRFHHSRQIAAYASLSAEGAEVAIQRYLGDGVARMLVPMWLDAARVADVRGNPKASMVWQDISKAGRFSPTWALSDAARAQARRQCYTRLARAQTFHIWSYLSRTA